MLLDEEKYHKYKDKLLEYVESYDDPENRDVKIYTLNFKIDKEDKYSRCRLNYLNVRQENKNFIPSGFIDDIGMQIYDWPEYWGHSLYANNCGVYFFGKPNKKFKGFSNYKNARTVYTIPFKCIENIDFENGIDYHPLVYVNSKNYVTNKFRISPLRRNEGVIFARELNKKNRIKKFGYIKVLEKNLQIWLRKKLRLEY